MEAGTVDLERFALGGILGEGADLQVFAATDTETGRPAVVKRPHPTLVERQHYQDVEHKIARSMRLRQDLGDGLPHVPRPLGCSPVEPHGTYFGDTLPQPYLVSVEERATGLPLVGSVVDGVKGLPIGLPQNLFALHPLKRHPDRGAFSILRDILDIAEALYAAGYLLLDVSPHNVYFDPLWAEATLIDIGSVTVEQPATRRRAPVDLHDFYLELFKWYTTPAQPPREPAAYAAPHGMDSVAAFARDLAWMKVDFSSSAPEQLGTTALAILERVSERSYTTLGEFREEFDLYLRIASETYEELSEAPALRDAWRKALVGLQDPYWGEFLFQADRDLAPYLGVD